MMTSEIHTNTFTTVSVSFSFFASHVNFNSDGGTYVSSACFECDPEVRMVEVGLSMLPAL